MSHRMLTTEIETSQEKEMQQLESSKVQVRERVYQSTTTQVYRGLYLGVTDVALKKDESTFSHEYTMLKTLRHPHVVELFGCYQDDTSQYLVLEYCAEGNALDYVRRNTLGLDHSDLLAIAGNIAGAMVYLEQMGMAHGHIRASNVLIRGNKPCIAKLADFSAAQYATNSIGWVKSVDVRWKVRLVRCQNCGNDMHKAPELLSHEGQYSTATDVWAFAVFLWELFSRGMVPYADVAEGKVKSHVLRGERLQSSVEWPAQVVDMLPRCFHVEGSRRMSAKAIGSALIGIDSGTRQEERETDVLYVDPE